MGSRYGGLKQIDQVGPSGESVLDYAVFDAIRTGFGRVVFIIRRDFEEVFRAQIGAKYSGKITVDYVFQSIDELPDGFTAPTNREKPWGTGHAVWCAREVVKEPFAVINADDFYGADSFNQLGQFLTKPVAGHPGYDPMSGHKQPSPPVAEFAMVGFQLANTLSENGTVSRGICKAGRSGHLSTITEQTGISSSDVGEGQIYSGEEIASMNCWGFTPSFFSGLDAQFRTFLSAHLDDPKAEFYLPTAVSAMIGQREANVTLLSTDSAWFGITYQEDKPHVVAAIADLVRAQVYPKKLF